MHLTLFSYPDGRRAICATGQAAYVEFAALTVIVMCLTAHLRMVVSDDTAGDRHRGRQ
jgi:hypothetical protein